MKYPELISSAPLVALHDSLLNDLQRIRRRTPDNDVATVLDSVSKELDEALREAANADVWVSVPEAAARVHRPYSTITRICREYGSKAGAHKMKGIWSIHWRTFEAFFAGRQSTTAKEAA